MDSELIKWLAQMPKNYSLSGSKTSFYNGEKQLKLFLKIKDNQLFLVSLLILPTETHDTTTTQSTNRTKSYDSKQKRLFRYDIIYHFIFWCQLLRTRTYRRLHQPTNPSKIINAHTQYTTPHQLGFFIVYWLVYSLHPTNTPRTEHHTHRPPHPQATAGAGQQKFYYLLGEPRTY